MLQSALDRMFKDINSVLARAVRAASTVLLLLMLVSAAPSSGPIAHAGGA